MISSIIKIGLPTAIGGSTMQLGTLLMTRNVNVYGYIATSAYGIGNKINSLITMPASGIGSAVSTIVGQNIGADNRKRADKAFHYSLRICAVFLLILGFILSRRPVSQAMVSFFHPMPKSFLLQPTICPLLLSGAGQMLFIMYHRDYFRDVDIHS